MASGIVEYISPRDLMRSLKVCRKTLDNWIRAGRIPPPVKIGRTLRWHPDALQGALRGVTPEREALDG